MVKTKKYFKQGKGHCFATSIKYVEGYEEEVVFLDISFFFHIVPTFYFLNFCLLPFPFFPYPPSSDGINSTCYILLFYCGNIRQKTKNMDK